MPFESKKYWIDRYATHGGNSGVGSYRIYAEYKANIINKFFIDYNIETVLELGCGDGNQLSYLKPKKYYGYDISDFVISKNKKRFNGSNYFFTTNLDELKSKKFDVVLSLDVIYHLIEDNNYYEYMKNLFFFSKKYVIIYSTNNNNNWLSEHCKNRIFMNDISNNFKLINKIDNPLKGENTQSDFYFFKNEKNEI